MNFKKLWICILFLAFVVIVGLWHANTVPKKSSPVNRTNLQTEQTENFNNEIEEQDMEKRPDALDYMAPGHSRAKQRVEEIKRIRQQTINEQDRDLDKLGL